MTETVCRPVLGLDLTAILTNQVENETLVGKVTAEEYETQFNESVIEEAQNIKPQNVKTINNDKTTFDILHENTDTVAIDLSIDNINPANDKYLKHMKFVWRKKDDGKMYIYNNMKNCFTSENRGERYKFIPPELAEKITKGNIIDVKFTGNIFNFTLQVKDKIIFISDNHMSVAEGVIFTDGEMFTFKHTENEIMAVYTYLQTLDKTHLKNKGK